MKTKRRGQFSPDYAVAPGKVLEEWLDERGMTQTELAERMGRPIKTVNEIIQGKARIIQETALQLESVTGIEASFWTNAERVYRERAARAEEQVQLAAWGEWARLFPFCQMVKRGWVAEAASVQDRVQALLRYFGVASPDAWYSVYEQFQVAYRKSPSFKSDPAHLAAWLRQGEIAAGSLDCEPYTENGFKKALGKVREITCERIEPASDKVVELCRQVGVSVVFVPELSKTHVSGATRWLKPTKALMQLSLRHKSDDHLWFSFFHEAAHILLHTKKGIIMEFNGKTDALETEANLWAGQFLLPRADVAAFCQQRPMTDARIKAFAKRMGVSPGIVVGRLQHDGVVPHMAFNHLKRRLQFIRPRANEAMLVGR